MNLYHTITAADAYSLVAYAGLICCLLWVVAQAVALLRFRLRLQRHADDLITVLSGNRPRWIRLPAYMERLVAQLQTTDTSERALEMRMLLRNRLHRAGTTVKISAPAFGVAGTMSGAWAFLAEFDRSASLGGQPSMQGLTDATVTTWIGLMVMVGVVLLMNWSSSLIDSLMQRTSEGMQPQAHNRILHTAKPRRQPLISRHKSHTD